LNRCARLMGIAHGRVFTERLSRKSVRRRGDSERLSAGPSPLL
jgi:hypothetical protein